MMPIPTTSEEAASERASQALATSMLDLTCLATHDTTTISSQGGWSVTAVPEPDIYAMLAGGQAH